MAKTNDGVHFEISADANDTVKELENVEKSLNKTQKAAKDLKSSLKNSGEIDIISSQTLNNAADKIGKAIEEPLNHFKQVADEKAGEAGEKAVSTFAEKIVKIAQGMDTAGKIIENGFGRVLGRITATVSSISGVITLVTRNALSIGGSFETQMTNVKVISGATGEELEELTKKAREMGAMLPITAQDAAQAMELLAQRGTKARDIISSVTDVAALSISQNVDMASAASLLGSTMTNFGLAVGEASRITDIFNNASNQSALNMSKLTESLKYVAPSAASAGMSLEETVAAMEILANAGLEGSMIGTGLSGVISTLASNSEVLHVQTKKVDGTLRPLKDIFKELQARGLTLSEATELFGIRAAKSALNLAKYSSTLGENEQNLKQLGSTQAAVQEKMKTWPNTWNAFRSAMDEVHIEIFEQIKEQSKDAVSEIANLTRSFSKWINRTQIASKSFDAFLSGLGINVSIGDDFQALLNKINVTSFVEKIKSFGKTLKDIAGAIASFFSAIKTPLLFLIEHIDTFGKISFWGWIVGKGLQVPAAIIGLAGAFKQLYGAFKLLSGIDIAGLLSLLMTPKGWIVAGIAAVGATAYYVNSKYQEAREAEEEKRRIEAEIKALNDKAEFEVNLNLSTGFEALPEAFHQASAEVQSMLNENVAAMQNVFKNKIVQAIDDVNKSAGDLGEKFHKTAKDISDTLATQITRALQGSKSDFEQLPEYWKKVTERLDEMGIKAGQVTGNIKELINTYKAAKNISSTSDSNEYFVYVGDIFKTINKTIDDFPKKLERLSGFIDEQDMELAVDVQLDTAHKELQNFTKKAAEKYRVPEEIVEAGLLKRLKDLASQNNKTAQSIINGWRGARDKFSDFMNKAKDAVDYLGASPAQFTPVLNKLTAGIQKIDPVTGKVTEAFKKAYNALKEWSNTNFDRLTRRIQSIKKATEGGFLDKKALQDEFKNFSEQLKIQVKADLEPTRSQYSKDKTFYGVVASEYMSRLSEIGGTAFVAKAKEEFSKAGKITGEDIGKEIISGIKKSVITETKTINGQKVITNRTSDMQSASQTVQDKVNNISQEIVNGLKPLLSGLENNQTGYNVVAQNVVNTVAPATLAMQSLVTGLDSTRSSLIENTNAINQAYSAMSSIIETLKTQQGTSNNIQKAGQKDIYLNTSENNTSQNQGITQELINGLTPFITQLERTQTQYIQIAQETANNISLINLATQTLISTLSATGNVTAANTSAIGEAQNTIASAVNAMEKMPASNTFNIEIHQSGFTVQNRSEANVIANSTVSAIRNGIGNGM